MSYMGYQVNLRVQTIRASKTRYKIAYKGDNYSWYLSARSVGGPGDILRIKSFMSNHSCIDINHSGHQQATVKFIRDSIGSILSRVQKIIVPIQDYDIKNIVFQNN